MSLLFNPFYKIAGTKALLIGLAFALITLAIAPFSYAAFDGVLDFHKVHFENWWTYSIVYFISWFALVSSFGIAALLFSKVKVRWIDIIGTTLLAKAPLLPIAIIAFYIPELHQENITSIGDLNLNFVTIIALIKVILCTIWMVALLFNAYRVSLNIKGNKAIWTFILILLCAEIFSLIIIHFSAPFLN